MSIKILEINFPPVLRGKSLKFGIIHIHKVKIILFYLRFSFRDISGRKK